MATGPARALFAALLASGAWLWAANLSASDGAAGQDSERGSAGHQWQSKAAQPTAHDEHDQLANESKPKLKWQPYRGVKSPAASSNSSVVLATAVEPADSTQSRRPGSRSAALQAAKSRAAAARSAASRTSRAKIRDEVLGVKTAKTDAFDDPFDDRLPARPASQRKAVEEEPAEESTDAAAMPEEEPAEEKPAPFKSRPEPFPDDQLPAPAAEVEPGEEGPAARSTGGPCADDQKACEENLETLRSSVISKIPLDVGVSGQEGKDYPCECRLGNAVFQPRLWSETVYTWKASGLCHKPLYFEEVALERYGHAWNPVIQPFVSGAHFFCSIALLPYQMGIDPPNECVYTLGYYRPGDCAPYLIDPIPWSCRGAVLEGTAVTAAALIFFP